MPNGKVGRRKPYTVRGIRRVPCVRCGKPARYQWGACSLDNRWCPVCETCDIDLNDMVLTFFNIDGRGVLLEHYKQRVRREQA